MPIRMRHNNKPDTVCSNCGAKDSESLNMFDICIGETIQTLCDVCNEKVLRKTLSAEVFKDGRVKSKRDIQIKHSRNRKGLN